MHLTTLSLLTIASNLASALPSASTSFPDDVRVASISYAGSGCSASTLSGPFSSDGKTFGLPHGTLVAQSGPGTTAASNRKNCQIALKIRYSPGWQFSIARAEYSGYANLPDGVEGSSVAIIYFAGESRQAESSKTIDGPFAGDYTHVAKFVGGDAVWSPCGSESILNINADARLDPDNIRDTAKISVNTPENVDVVWRRC